MKRWEELREELIGWLESSCFDGDPRTWGPDAEKDIDAIIAAVREDEREKCANYMLWRRDELEDEAGIDPKVEVPHGATVEGKEE